MMKQPAVYMLANRRGGDIYIGVTSNLATRVTQHKEGQVHGFSKAKGTHILVWYCYFDEMTDAIREEKRLKNWHRGWKVRLIEKENPNWDDLDI